MPLSLLLVALLLATAADCSADRLASVEYACCRCQITERWRCPKTGLVADLVLSGSHAYVFVSGFSEGDEWFVVLEKGHVPVLLRTWWR